MRGLGNGGESQFMPYGVLNIQQGLMAYFDTGHIEVSPGRIDGAWGPSTLASYLAFLRFGGSSAAAVERERGRLAAFPTNSRVVTLPIAAAQELGAAAVRYAEVQEQQAGPGRQASQQAGGYPGFIMPPLPPSAPRAPQSNVLPIVCGVGAAALVVGGIYYFWLR